MSSHVSLTLLN